MPLLPMGPPPGGGMPMPPPQGPPGLPLGAGAPPPGMGAMQLPPPPTPAETAGVAAMQLVPQQQAEQAQLVAQQQAAVMAMLMDQLSNQPNPAAEAAQGMPAAQVTPDAGVPDGDESMQGGAY